MHTELEISVGGCLVWGGYGSVLAWLDLFYRRHEFRFHPCDPESEVASTPSGKKLMLGRCNDRAS